MSDTTTPYRADKPLRSLLFVPADSEKKILKGLDSSADALVLDLEDSVMPDRKSAARETLSEVLSGPPSSYHGALWVRINPLATEYALDDLCAVIGPAIQGILLPKCEGPRDVEAASHYIDALARRAGLKDERIGILPVVTETASAPFALGGFRHAALPRLWGMTWGAEDLSSAIGAATNIAPDGTWAFTYKMVRSQCLLAAKAANVQAIETLYVDFRDDAGLRRSCVEARREGFNGRFAIHPAQVDGINEGFMPAQHEVDEARAIVATFTNADNSGAVAMDGRMLDIPHLKQAKKVLELHKAFAFGASG